MPMRQPSGLATINWHFRPPEKASGLNPQCPLLIGGISWGSCLSLLQAAAKLCMSSGISEQRTTLHGIWKQKILFLSIEHCMFFAAFDILPENLAQPGSKTRPSGKTLTSTSHCTNAGSKRSRSCNKSLRRRMWAQKSVSSENIWELDSSKKSKLSQNFKQ